MCIWNGAIVKFLVYFRYTVIYVLRVVGPTYRLTYFLLSKMPHTPHMSSSYFLLPYAAANNEFLVPQELSPSIYPRCPILAAPSIAKHEHQQQLAGCHCDVSAATVLGTCPPEQSFLSALKRVFLHRACSVTLNSIRVER